MIQTLDLANSDFFIFRTNFTLHKLPEKGFVAFYNSCLVEIWGDCTEEELSLRIRTVKEEYIPSDRKIAEAMLHFYHKKPVDDFSNCRNGKLNLKDFKYFQKLKPDKTFLVDSMIYPKTTTMLYSPPAQFKSLLALNMALAVATGTEFLGMKCKKYPVLYCDKENNDQLLKDRLMGLWKGQGLKARNMPLKFLTRNGDLMDEDFIEKLKACIKEHKFKLIFFDTLHRFADYEENKADDINRIYTQVFVPLVDELGCSIIFLHHSKKDGGYRGSGDLLGMVDTCYSVFRNAKSGRFELNCEKSRAGEIENIIGEIDFGDEMIKVTRLSEVICKKEKTLVFRATLANIEGIFFGKDLKLTRKEVMERLEMEKIEFSRATVTRALAWCVEEKKTLVKETKVNVKGMQIETGRYMNPLKVEINYVVEENKKLDDFTK